MHHAEWQIEQQNKNNSDMKLFNFVKGIFGRPATDAAAVETVSDETTADLQPEAAESGYTYPAESEEAAAPVESVKATAPAPEVDVNNSEVVLPLANIIPTLPPELQQRVLVNRVANTSISLPLSRILSQLAQGSVRVTFGEKIGRAHV